MSNRQSRNGCTKGGNRNLPSSMTSKDRGNKSHGKKNEDAGYGDSAPNKGASDFSKLLDGVIFVLSGFVNPERSMLRSQALEMGGEYRPDWTSDCTLLVCAFPNTPKFRQVEADGGTIVSKEWILECYNTKKLVEIERYLMHAGKPWRKKNKVHVSARDGESSQHQKVHQREGKKPDKKQSSSAKSGVGAPISIKLHFSPSKLKEWAADDLSSTILWLDSQEEKPEPSELKKIAAQGVITCLEDSITALKENQDVNHVMEQWRFVPRVVEELSKLVEAGSSTGLPSKEELFKQAITCKQVYQMEYGNMDADPPKSKKHKTDKADGNKTRITSADEGFDSDETVVMTEEEIDLACKDLASKH